MFLQERDRVRERARVRVVTDQLLGRRLRVHYNLQRGDFSVVDGGLVIASVSTITLANVEFRVGEKMRQWTIAHNRRKVMAYGIGIVVPDETTDGRVKITYNPFRCGSFHEAETGEPVWSCASVVFADAYCWGSDD